VSTSERGRQGLSNERPQRSPVTHTSGPPGSLRKRLLAALVGVSAGSILLAGVITLGFARGAIRSELAADLRQSLAEVPSAVQQGELPNLNRLRRLLGARDVAVVFVTRAGRVMEGRAGRTLLTGPVAAGVQPGQLDTDALLAGRTQTGGRGSIVFVAQPLDTRPLGVPVVVVTRRVGAFPLGRLGSLLVVAAAVAAAVAAGVSVLLARRLTRPLAAMERAARAIAAGDLQARVGDVGPVEEELVALGSALDGMAAELERARGLERAFLMSVSHDLRTPLTSIRGYAEALAEGTAEGEEARKRAAAVIGSEARRLERLVADLLDLARLDAREFSLHPRPVDAAEVVTESVEAFRPAATEAGVQLTFVNQGGRVEDTVLDPERLAQVVANLVENALKYAVAAITVEVGATGDQLTVAVSDDGPGIDPGDLPHVFERLYASRTQPGRKVGTGLGLAIVRELASVMGGGVEAARTPEGGTRLVVSLARRAPGSSATPADGWSSSSTSSSWSSTT
jgi:two-component system OmpR family sensor kinase